MKKIQYVYEDENNNTITQTGIIVVNDIDIGVTIIDENDKDDYLICFNGPLSPGINASGVALFKILYPVLQDMIKEGIVNADIIMQKASFLCSNPTQADCVLNQ